MYSVTRTDAKKIAAHIEVLAKQVQDNLEKDTDDFWLAANELVRDSSTMIFVLGELHASEQLGSRSMRKSRKTAAKSTRKSRVYYRDNLGRFASKKTGKAYLVNP